MLKHVLFGTFLICLCACTESARQPYSRYESFPEEKSLTGRVIPIDTAIFRYAYRIAVHDSTAVIMDLHNSDYFYHVFTYPGFEPILSFGRHGEGPDEYLSGENIRYVSDDSIWTADTQHMKIYRWSLSRQNRTAELRETIPVSKEKIRILDFAPYDGNEFFVPDYSGSCSFYRVDKQQQILEPTGILPTEAHPEDPSRVILGQVWVRFLDYHPGNRRLALVTQLGEVVEIYDTATGASRILYGPNGEPSFRLNGNYAFPDGIRGFSDVQITDRYIYAIFQGDSFKERALLRQAGQTPPDGGASIYVFDLEGNPVRKYRLDHHISGFHVDEANRLITGVEVNNDEPIVQFSL